MNDPDTSPRGALFVVSAPSGAGKHSIVSRALPRLPDLVQSISATTRAPRKGEQDGKDYHFLTRGEFERRIEAGGFAEWAEVHGNLYGTPKDALLRHIERGADVLLELDVQGMRRLRAMGMPMTAIFIMPPSLEELERRLVKRGADAPADIALRLANAREEMDAHGEYDHVIVNGDLDKAVEEFEAIVRNRTRLKTTK